MVVILLVLCAFAGLLAIAAALFAVDRFRRKARQPHYWLTHTTRLNADAPSMDLLALKSNIANALKHLDGKELNLASARDYCDKADSYWILGELQNNMMVFDAAEKCYRAAIDVYNETLAIDPNHADAIAHKFKVVESLSALQRNRF